MLGSTALGRKLIGDLKIGKVWINSIHMWIKKNLTISNSGKITVKNHI